MTKHSFRVTILKGSHFFKIVNFDNKIKELAFQFVRRFIRIDDMATKEGELIPAMTVYAGATRNRQEFRFHINALGDWIKLLDNHGLSGDYKIETIPDYEPYAIDAPIRGGWALREHQKPLVEYILQDKDKTHRSRFIGLQTGQGKTKLSLYAISQLKMRTIVIVKPIYMVKWFNDIRENLMIDDKEIMSVSGGKELKAFLQLCEMDALSDVKFIIISNKTYQLWLKAYEEYGQSSTDLGYAFYPDQLFEKAKAGIRLIDEVHQDFHLCFKTDLYTHTLLSISLSATLDTYDPKIKEMQEVAYPTWSRADTPDLVIYADTYAVHYHIALDRTYKTSEYARSSYSHTAFEKSIMRHHGFQRSYFEMIKDVLDISYIKKKKPGQKAIVFASTINMCDALTRYLQHQYPHLSVKRFCEKDAITNLHEADIRVTNVIKGGTAHDIKDLVTVVLTIGIDSLQANLQIFGRLREIEGSDTEFYYFVCQDIPKHKTYHKNKVGLLKPRSRHFNEIRYPRKI